MYHAELGKSTADIWEEEQREARLEAYRKRKQLENIATGLGNLLWLRQQESGYETPITNETMNGVNND